MKVTSIKNKLVNFCELTITLTCGKEIDAMRVLAVLGVYNIPDYDKFKTELELSEKILLELDDPQKNAKF